MSLTKEAVLKLKTEGFGEAEKHARMIAAFVDHAAAATRSMEALVRSTGASFRYQHDQLAKTVPWALQFETALEGIEARARAAALATRGIGGGRLPGAGAPGPGGGAGAGAGAAVGAASLGSIAAAAAVVTGALYAANAAGESLFDTIGRGETIAALSASFQQLSGPIGGAAATLAALQQATGGVVDNQTLMLATNKLMIADIGLSQQQVAGLAAAAVTLSKAMGTTASSAVRDLAEGLQKQSPMILDNLGLTVKMEAAVKEYAAAHHLASSEVDDQARKLLFAKVAMDGAAEAEKKLGTSGLSTIKATEQMSVAWKNFGDQIDRLVADQPGFTEALKATADAAIAIGTALTPLIQLAGQVASELAPLIKLLGQGAAYLAGSGSLATLAGGALSALPGGALVGAPIAALGAAQGSASALGYTGMRGSAAPASKIEVNITAGTPREVAEKTQRELERFNREQVAAPGFGG